MDFRGLNAIKRGRWRAWCRCSEACEAGDLPSECGCSAVSMVPKVVSFFVLFERLQLGSSYAKTMVQVAG